MEVISKIHIVAMFLIIDLQEVFHTYIVGRFIFYFHTKFRTPSSNSSLGMKLYDIWHGLHFVIFHCTKNSVKVLYFSSVYCHTSFQYAKLGVSIVSPTSQIFASAILLLLILRNKEARSWYGFHTKFREIRQLIQS
jgi:hypothetical protein